ncbi:hypothetical protein ZAINNY_6 [Bacillus phage Zainny]|nr:hypothetical protein ZAINNY_6 [Bacillus phage Zainny]
MVITMGKVLFGLGVVLALLWWLTISEVSKDEEAKKQFGFNPSTFNEVMNIIMVTFVLILTFLYTVSLVGYMMGVIR